MSSSTNNSPPCQENLPISSSNSTTTTLPFHNLPPDCIHTIFHYKLFHLQHGNQWKQYHNSFGCLLEDLEKLENVELQGMADSFQCNYNFLRKFAHCCCFYGNEGVREFLSTCRDWQHKPTFSYLQLEFSSLTALSETGAVEYLRGIPELVLTKFWISLPHETRQLDDTDIDNLFHNIRGVRKLSLHLRGGEKRPPLKTHNLENLRGIQEAHFEGFDFDDRSLENLRGIQCLTLLSCGFKPDSNRLFQNIRGVQELCIRGASRLLLNVREFENLRGIRKLNVEMTDCFLSDEHLQNIRGIRELEVNQNVASTHTFENQLHSLTFDSYKNLRGVKRLKLVGFPANHVTDIAFSNLRGIEELCIVGMPHLTSKAFEHLRGIKILNILDCTEIDFASETLYNLRGIRELYWNHGRTRKELTCDALKQLHGVKKLELDSVVVVSEKAFQHLSEVEDLFLKADSESSSLNDLVFSHLGKIQQLKLVRMDLQQVSNASSLLRNCMPHLELFLLMRCDVRNDFTESIEDTRVFAFQRKTAFRKVDGKWCLV